MKTASLAFNRCLKQRDSFQIHSNYKKEEGVFQGLGSTIQFETFNFQLSNVSKEETNLSHFSEQLPPCFKLMIFGAEHDAVQLVNWVIIMAGM